MAKGKPSSWADVSIKEGFSIGKSGIEIKIWKKYGKKHLGYITISIGGIRWTPYGKQKAKRLITWKALSKF
ncbi:MAG: hypothetical protein M1491_09140 [Deltaproteobacteria bacterium]|nr:hypothetical protein [Deltaproteobacteria bacterium]MCL5276803.1 hypothetical protein [Deltaproteobacteria bacterium]